MISKIIRILFIMWYLLPANTTFAFTHADTLRGSNGNGRNWWDVQRYNLNVAFDIPGKSINGSVFISFKVLKTAGDSMQIDLQDPMVIDSAYIVNPTSGALAGLTRVNYVKDGNTWWMIHKFSDLAPGKSSGMIIHYHGKPKVAINPPWQGGFTWSKDANGNPWVSVSCQGLGASVWWPCKDAQWDEPDNGMFFNYDIPESLKLISNGTLMQPQKAGKGRWYVKNPINTYDVSFYIGDYVQWSDTLMGEKGELKLTYAVLRDNEAKARKQFAVVKQMLHCFEYWMGPYPFYEDGYKLVDAPYLGMEHQGAIAYGNQYKMGYKGTDRSGTGIGMNFDYIIVHETGHEWFGNNVTARDAADNWIHESFTTYSESLFAECLLGKEKGMEYSRGEWEGTQNDKPIIGHYGVNDEGSGDMYDKGTAIMYMIRTMTNDDEKFRTMLRGLGKEFYHQQVTTKQVEDYISKQTGLDLAAFFDQYLRKANVPELEYYIKEGKLHYKFNNIADNFTLPIPVSSGDTKTVIKPTAEWQQMKWNGGFDVKVSKDFLVTVKK